MNTRVTTRRWGAGIFRTVTIAGAMTLIIAGCAPAQTSPAPAAPAPAPVATVAPTRTPAQTPTQAPATPVPARATPTVAAAAPQIKRGGTLQLTIAGAIPHWDPHRYTGLEIWEYLGNYLLNFDPKDGSPVPDLAESWEFKDSKTLVLHIRKSVKYHNLPPVSGREFTAEDAVWNLQRMSRPGADYLWRSNFEPVESFAALDKYTVQIKLKFPFPPILSYLKGTTLPTQPMMAPEVEEKLGGPDAYKDLTNARGTGPVMIKSFTPGVGAHTVRNPDYWQQGRPYLDAVDYYLLGDTATMIAAYRVGRVDYGATGSSAIDIVAKQNLERTNPNIKFTTVPDPWVIALVPNVKREPFTDVRLRKAMFLALDRQEELKLNLGGGGHISGPISWRLFPGWTWSEEELLKREGYRAKNTPEGQRDIAEAQRLMRELGYGPDKPLVVEAEATQSPGWLNLTPTEIAKSELQKIWINMSTIKLVDQAQYFAQDNSGAFLLRSRGYNAPSEPDAQLYSRHHTSGTRNFQKLSDPELDKLLEQQRQELDISKRKQIILQAQERLWNLYPQMWLHTRDAFLPQQPWVEMQPTPWRRWGDPTTTQVTR